MNETTGTPSGSTSQSDDQSDDHTGGPPPDPRADHRSDWDQVKDVRTLQRPADRMVAGVAAGLARHLNVDPLVLRVAFVVLSFFGGIGVILYGALWLLLPEEGRGQAVIHLDERSRGVALLGLVALAALALVGDSWGLYSFPWPLAIIAVVVWFFWQRSKKKDATTTQAYPEGWTPPPAAVQRPPLARPRDPRRRGPVLFWFTLALITLLLGVLGTVDLAGVSVADSAYPALALTVSGVMLVIGAFWGRAGGIILLALIAAFATLGALATESWQRDGSLVFEPTTSSQVRDYYELRNGELTLDLTGVTDPETLTSRDIEIVGFTGRITVLLPEDVNYAIDSEVAVGSIQLLDQNRTEGVGLVRNAVSSSPRGAPALQIATELAVGDVVVIQP